MNNKLFFICIAFVLSTTSLISKSALARSGFHATSSGHIAVANRASGTVSIIDTQTDLITHSIDLPQAESPAEPMYVVYKENRLYVGDRANNRVVVYDSFSFHPLAEIAVGKGVFHMWAAADAQLLLVNNDIDNSITLIDTNELSAITSIAIPQDLATLGFKPHDVYVSADGASFFISLIDGKVGSDYVIKYELWRGAFRETARREVGGDPHLFISSQKPQQLFVASQDASMVNVLTTYNLTSISQVAVPNAHGIFSIGRRLYLSNIGGGGIGGLVTLDALQFRTIDQDDTPYATPHNISVTDDGLKIYVTHSGATQNKVSIFNTRPETSLPQLSAEVTVGLNPFGLAFIPH